MVRAEEKKANDCAMIRAMARDPGNESSDDMWRTSIINRGKTIPRESC